MRIPEKDQGRPESDLETARKQASEYAMALDLLARLSQADTENQAIEDILEIFTVLFSPRKAHYISLRDEKFWQIHSSFSTIQEESEITDLPSFFTEKFVWTASGEGFSVKIFSQGEALGIVEIDEISLPEYKEQYLNLALSIVDVCGLVIENARKRELLKKSEQQLREEKEKLEQALTEVQQLSGLLPICMHCKKIRDDKGYWNQIEMYISKHSKALFSHGICQECEKKYYPD